MKAEELMIGDWLWYQGQFNAFPFKVEQVTKRKVGYHAESCECHMNYLRLCECRPIPITPEILERNGFILESDGWVCYEDIENDEKNYIVSVSDIMVNLEGLKSTSLTEFYALTEPFLVFTNFNKHYDFVGLEKRLYYE